MPKNTPDVADLGVIAVDDMLFVDGYPPPEKLERTTVDWSRKMDAYSGLSDWRLHLAFLAPLTVALYARLW